MKIGKSPKEIRNLIEVVQFKQAPFLNKVPEEMLKEIGSYLDDPTLSSSLARTNQKEVNTLLKPERVFTKFLQQVVYGGKDKV